jgi:hypothetical protein
MKFIKLIFYILVILAIGISLYRYFKLDQNHLFQKAIQNKDFASAELVLKDVVGTQIKAQAKQYVYGNNGYFVSQSNNVCTSIKSNLSVLDKINSNPVECSADVHTFTARIKTLSNSYYCVDTSGFYTTGLTEVGYKAGVSCK